ncbi:hypothetical protein FD754_003241 [Muntiacus muntjak]|uniref:Peptidase S1 domain-containing protein n=1 Tax=Muntiacus muntjak TaxID=9888 RepID=A0A5N3WEH0_MUNMU|nr:hypothetical protein FD754_003241 [Muntiacus muntjak]
MAGPRRPQPGCHRRTAAAVNLLLGVFHVLLPCGRPGGAQGQAIEPMPNVVELWQAEEGELLLPTQVRTAEVTGPVLGEKVLLGWGSNSLSFS